MNQLGSMIKDVRSAVLVDAGMNIIVGSINQGKTATMFYLMELCHNINPSRRFFLHVPFEEVRSAIRSLIPSFIELTSDDMYLEGSRMLDYNRVPCHTVIGLEEPTRYANSKNVPKGEIAEKIVSDLATIRHRGQSALVPIQSMALLQLDYMRMGFNLLVKRVSPLALKFERPELSVLLEVINDDFEHYTDYYDIRELLYIQSLDAGGMFRIPLPSFWSERLSALWGANTMYERVSMVVQ